MRDKADLTDNKEQLEHIILQLQGETDTIGKIYRTWGESSFNKFVHG